jgi:hypothetical protein
MNIYPLQENMSELLRNLVIEIEENRKSDSPVKRAWVNSCKRIGLESNDPFVQFGLKFANHPDLIHSDNKYHNHLHSADAIISSSFLAKEEFSNDDLKNNGALLIFSMMCHDIAHNGGHNNFDYELEKAAVKSMNDYMQSHQELLKYWNHNLINKYGSWEWFSNKVESVILGTDFKNGPKMNLLNYKKQQIDMNRIHLLANEADILPSCTSKLGPKLGLLLALEQNNPNIGTWKSRELFISKLVNLGSIASEKIGIKEHIAKQIQIMHSIGIEELDRKSLNGNFLKIAEEMNRKATYTIVSKPKMY